MKLSLPASMARPVMAALALLCASPLMGCGFQPLYQSGPGSAQEQLAEVYVASIGGRFGQEIRLYLQQNFSGAGPENPTKYSLTVGPSLGEEAIDIHKDNSSGRTRVTASAHWILSSVEAEPKVIAEGIANTVDGYDVLFEQYFMQNLNDSTVQARVAKALADQITQQLAGWFTTHRPAANQSGTAPSGPTYVVPGMVPGDLGDQLNRQAPGADGLPAMATGRQEMQPYDPDPLKDMKPSSGP